MNTEMTITKQDRDLIASCRHLIVFFGIVSAVALAGFLAQHRTTSGSDLLETHAYAAPAFLSAAFLDWLLVLFVWRGIRRRGVTIRSLIQGRWANARDILMDLGIAALFWGILLLVELGFGKFLGSILGLTQAKSIQNLLPQTAVEGVLWCLVSISAGFCEELVFRGYLQRQLLALTGNLSIAVLGQGIIFALMHVYEGWASVVHIVIIGVLFGVLAVWRKTLRVGMVSHAWYDIWAGLLSRFVK
jgi:uncharacterized protein